MSTLALTRRKTSVWGVLAVLGAGATGLSIYSYLSWVRAQVPVAGRLAPLVIASMDLEPGTVIGPGQVRLTDHPDKYMPPGAVGSIDRVLGKVVSVPVFMGEAVTARKLGKKGGLSSVVPDGMRVYSLGISMTGGLVPRPGDRVDVLVTFPREVLGEAATMTVLRGKEVGTVVGSNEATGGKVASQIGLEGNSKHLGITLFVTPQEAERLAMAEAMGKVTLVLAPNNADDSPAPKPISPRDVAAP